PVQHLDLVDRAHAKTKPHAGGVDPVGFESKERGFAAGLAKDGPPYVDNIAQYADVDRPIHAGAGRRSLAIEANFHRNSPVDRFRIETGNPSHEYLSASGVDRDTLPELYLFSLRF